MEQFVKLLRPHTFEFALQLPAVVSVVRLGHAALSLSLILAHELPNLRSDFLLAAVHGDFSNGKLTGREQPPVTLPSKPN